MAEDRTPQDADKYIVRFPDGMRERLKIEAHTNKRTLNAEIVARLEASFGAHSAPVPAQDLAHLYDLLMAQTELQRLMTEQQAAKDSLFWAAQDLEKTDKALAELIRRESQGEEMDATVEAHEAAAKAYLDAGKASTAAFVAVRDQQNKIAAMQQPRKDGDSKRYVTARPDGSIAPFEPPEERTASAPEAPPDFTKRLVNRRSKLLSPDLGATQVDQAMAHYAAIVRPAAEPVPPKPPANKGPARSSNAKRRDT